MQFSIKIISSGSKANAVLYDNKILIDIGTPYSKLKEYLPDVKLILLTHKHKDHINDITFRKILVEHEHIIFGVPEHLAIKFEQLGISKDRYHVYKLFTAYNYQTYKIVPLKLYHDVPNVGYRIIRADGYKHIHITDTKTVEGIGASNYDSAAIECNYEEVSANNLIELARREKTFTHVYGSLNSHLSVQQTQKFIKDNNIKLIVPLHISSKMSEEVIDYLKQDDSYAIGNWESETIIERSIEDA